ncbi:MAG: hypothetical protein WAR37_02370 [Candidatus Microsaccharimonas sp.]
MKKRIVIVSLIILVFVGIPIVWYFATIERPSDNSTPIKNFDSLVKNLPDTQKKNIYSALAIIVKHNNKDDSIDMDRVDDALIRKDSAKQTEVKEGTNYAGSFIVDIKSLQQSYRINYTYSSGDSSDFDSGYPIIASCLERSELIYGYFECEQPNAQLRESKDALLKLLPYKTSFYLITAIPSTNGGEKPTIIIQVMTNSNSERTREGFVLYKNEAIDWINKQGVSLDDYSLRYRNLLNQDVLEDGSLTREGD